MRRRPASPAAWVPSRGSRPTRSTCCGCSACIVTPPPTSTRTGGRHPCSMGDNVIHYEGHIRMMGAVQPFLSGSISKTANMPEDVTIDEVEALHLLSWKLGLKAVAIYRDNCKVGQPLSAAKMPTPADEA